MATQLNAVSSTLLPPTITGPIFAKASEQSAVMSLARKVPLSVSANTAIPVPMDIPVAGWVAEGGVKPAAQVGVGVKIMTGKKVALLVPVSKEVVLTNPAGLYGQLSQDLPTSIARAFDQAAVNGKDLRTGGAGPFTDYLSRTPQSVALGTVAQASGGYYADLVTAGGKVIDHNYDFTGWAADQRLYWDLALATDTTGRPLIAGTNTSAIGADAGGQNGTLIGFPASYSKGVSGKYWRGGDKSQTITVTATGGTMDVSSGGNTATAVAYNISAANLQTAIRAFGGIYAGVTVALSGGVYTITFPDVASNVTNAAAPFSVNTTSLTGGTATVAATGAGGVDTGLRAIGGDFSQCAWGQGMGISIQVSNEASYYDGSTWHSAFQENLTLLLVEAYFGFVVGDVNAFVAVTKGTATF
jgi:hypothetical protein